MNNNQKCLFNCLNEVLKVWYDKCGGGVNYEIKPMYSSIYFFTMKTCISWEFLELIKDITDKKGVGWEIGISNNNHLYLRLWK